MSSILADNVGYGKFRQPYRLARSLPPFACMGAAPARSPCQSSIGYHGIGWAGSATTKNQKLELATSRIDVALGRCREPRQLRRRSDRPSHQLTGTVRAAPGQLLGGAHRAKGALERAHAGVRAFRRQVAIAALAIRLELQHDILRPLGRHQRENRAARGTG